MPALGRLLCLLAALAVVEAPFLVMQGYAWATMVKDRAPAMGFEAAVSDTLSGEHPCPKCLALKGEREKKQERAPLEDHRQLCLLIPAGVARDLLASLPDPCARPYAVAFHRPASQTSDVPTPPPRVG